MGTRGPNQVDKSDQVVAALRANDRPFMGTGELADELGYSSNPGVTKHLNRAKDEGEIQKATISGYNIWYLPNLVQKSQVRDETTPGPAPGGGGGGGSPSDGESNVDEEVNAQLSHGALERVAQKSIPISTGFFISWIIGIVGYFLTTGGVAQLLFLTGIAFLGMGGVALLIGIFAQIALGRPLRELSPFGERVEA